VFNPELFERQEVQRSAHAALVQEHASLIEEYRRLRQAAADAQQRALLATDGRHADRVATQARTVWRQLYERGIAMDGDTPLISATEAHA
jgi:hypothetical protein